MLRQIGTSLLGAVLTFLMTSAWATLGGMGSDKATAALSGTESVITPSAGKTYAVHAYTDRSGVNVKEYVSATGVVFAVTWKGPTLPDMKHLLGVYFERYADALSRQQNRKYASVVQAQLVFTSTGGARFFTGYAYDPRLMPTEFQAKELG